VVFWYSIGYKVAQATEIEASMACCLLNARILADKSEHCAVIGQMTMNQYDHHLLSVSTVMNGSLEQIASTRQYIQTNLLNLWRSPYDGTQFLTTLKSLALMLYQFALLHWFRRPSYYSWWKM
jgi:hypothetical protein